MRSAAFALAPLAACASATQGNGGGGGGGGQDAPIFFDAPSGDSQQITLDAPLGANDAPRPIDAFVPPIDAPPDAPSSLTLTETTSPDDDGTQSSIACSNSDETSQDSWYRIFAPGDFNIPNGFHISRVDFVVEDAEGDPFTGTVRVGTYTGTIGSTLTKSKIHTQAMQTVTINAGDTSESVAIDADIAAGSDIAVELDVPAGTNTGDFFYIGANGDGESKLGYISSTDSDCDLTTPTSVTQVSEGVGGGEVDILMTVTGTPD